MNTLDHNLVTIPNNKVLTDVTSSGNYGALEMQVAMDFYIGLDQDVELASSIIQEACLTSRHAEEKAEEKTNRESCVGFIREDHLEVVVIHHDERRVSPRTRVFR